MTPSEVIELARKRYNAVGDSYFTDAEMRDSLWQACMELAVEAQCIYKRQTTSSVANQREYDLPARLLRPTRIVYDGTRLDQLDFIEDDIETGNDENTTSAGSPTYYTVFGDTLFLRPMPDTSAVTIKIYGIYEPDQITETSTLEIPVRYHLMTIDFLLFSMFAKDKNHQMASYHRDIWEKSVVKAKAWEIKAMTGEQFKTVKNIDEIPLHGIDIV